MLSTTLIQCFLLASSLSILPSTSFQINTPIITPYRRPTTNLLSSTTSTPSTQSTTPLLSRDRYVATNRFHVRPNKSAKFEKRWATRKSRLATLDGFRYFHLMRRVSLDDSTAEEDNEFGNYVSFTIWNQKKNFDDWRKGDAFKEAHGGTSITAFLSTMVNSALILKGAPRPAFYDGLLFQSTAPKNQPDIVDGWRNVEADGVNCLPAECFVACNQFYVPPENAVAFEQRWKNRESRLAECDGFVSFGMLRRDIASAKKKGHGAAPFSEDEPTYMSATIWRDRKAFDGWREGMAFKAAHGGENKGGEEKKREALWTKPPVPVFYEGTLVISAEEGA